MQLQIAAATWRKERFRLLQNYFVFFYYYRLIRRRCNKLSRMFFHVRLTSKEVVGM